MTFWERQSARVAVVLGGVAIVAGLCVFTVAAAFRSGPPTVDLVSAQGPVNLTVQTVASMGRGVHPTWVSYLVKDSSGKWVHSTIWELPANREIDVTVYEYDSGGALRNPTWGGITGTTGDVAFVNGAPAQTIDPGAGNGIAHTFNVPDLGINVPFEGISADAKKPCSTAPCDLSYDHNTITFSFMTPSTPGEYRWQCFVPCGLAYLYGNGGPMSTVGYMSGFLKVVA